MSGKKEHTISDLETDEFYGNNDLVYSTLESLGYKPQLHDLKCVVNQLNKKGVTVNISISYEG